MQQIKILNNFKAHYGINSVYNGSLLNQRASGQEIDIGLYINSE